MDKQFFRKIFPDCIYGGMDGIITTFAIVAGVAGAGLPASIIIILGVASVMADAFSMGASRYVSQRSMCSIEGNVCEPFFPLQTATATFLSFLVAGSMPLIPYIVGIVVPSFSEYVFITSISLAMILFFFIGYMEGVVAKNNSFVLGLKTLVIGLVAAGIAYGIGLYLSTLVQ